jgi:hypothetical protein
MSFTKSSIQDAILAIPAAPLTRPLPKGEERARGQLASLIYMCDLKGTPHE